MNRPTDPVQQCSSCHLQSIGIICGGGKRRINQNEKEEYYKTIDCGLWVERKIEKGPGGIKKCPTCGQVIVEAIPIIADTVASLTTQTLSAERLLEQVKQVFPDSIMVATDVMSDPFADIMDPTRVIEEVSHPAELSSDWGITVLDQQGVPEMQTKINNEVCTVVNSLLPGVPSEITSKPRRRRTSDIPKAKFSPGRRKKMEMEAVK